MQSWGADVWSLATGASHAQYLANHLGRSVTVNAFNSIGSEFKSRNGVNVYDGTTIRSVDVRSQQVKQTTFNSG